MTTRLLHFSDPHLESGLADAGASAFANKRALGFANLVLRRRRHFVHAAEKLASLHEFARQADIDFVLCTGDYTALGTRSELEGARKQVDALIRAPLGFATVPGNHDVYVGDGDGAFERLFADGLVSDLAEYRWERGQPFVRLVGEHVAIVGLESAHPNPVHTSSGRVSDAHMAALPTILGDARLASRMVLVALHYAPRLWSGRPDAALHGLENEAELLSAVARVRHGALVFGHIHHGYSVRVPGVAPPLVCAGSATYVGRESAVVWEVEAAVARCFRARYEDGRWQLAATPELELRVG